MTQKELEVINLLHKLNNPWIMAGFILLAIWSIVWKGFALWKAARNNQTAWYVIMLAVNTVGLLEIAYIFWFSKKEKPN